MIKDIQLQLTPEESVKEVLYRRKAAEYLSVDIEEITGIKIIKRSIDARKGHVKILMRMEVYIGEEMPIEDMEMHYPDVHGNEPVIIVGSGPAGLFAALRLIELGIRPIILERGKEVSARKLDIAKINRESIVNPDSNYAFGEGGAGTFSDGKLYTRSKKRGNVQSVLKILQQHGADPDIMVDAHPHIGTNKLPRIIQKIRETILNAGGAFYFNHHVDGLIIEKQQIKGVRVGKKEFVGKAVILATGHSARDIYELLYENNISLEAKSFAMGVRIEHPQKLIDQIQYHCTLRDDYLPAAAYSLVQQVDGRGVYSFCMCPGGFIVPAATADNEVVVNGMSPSRRDSKYANSGMVVEIRTEDLIQYKEYGVLAGLQFQKEYEQMAFRNGGLGQVAPAQRMLDFVKGKVSNGLPETSYQPGIISSPMHMWLPEHIGKRLQKGFKIFGKKMNGYLTNDAVIIGVESRTSSPLRIPREKETLQHPEIKGLYPCGEGAGYAGGIVSAAVDGQRVAESIKNNS